MSDLVKEFKAFVNRGNVLDLAVAVIIVSGWLSYSVSIIGTLLGINILMAGVFELAVWIDRERIDHFRVS